jgi:hypothetical protein
MKKNLGALLTAATTAEEAVAISKLSPSAGTTFVHGHVDPKPQFGVVQVRTKFATPTLREVLVGHLGRIRGKEAIGICLPEFSLSTDFTEAYNEIGGGKLEFAFAFSCKRASGGWPSFFVITTAVLPHIVNDIIKERDHVNFSSDGGWNIWLDNWLKKTMQPHRYVDLTNKGYIKEDETPISTEKMLPPETKETKKRAGTHKKKKK